MAGAVQTGTHGSGVKNSSLAGAVESIDLVRPCGEQVSLSRADGEEFLGSVVGLGALGIVTGLRLAVRPSFSMRQRVLENLPWERALADFTQLVSSGYSVSLFTDYVGDSISQVWLSPFYRQQSVALHFTWKPLQPQVEAVLPQLEDLLRPFGARLHWASFSCPAVTTGNPSTPVSGLPIAGFGERSGGEIP